MLCCLLVAMAAVSVFFAFVVYSLEYYSGTHGCSLVPRRHGDWVLVFLVNAVLEWAFLVIVKLCARDLCSRKVASSLKIDFEGA